MIFIRQESVKKQMVKEIKSNISSKKVISLEENILHAEFLTCLYFTFHHIPRAFYSFDFVERKYPELVQRIRKVVHSGLGIYDTMQLISPDVATICTGMAASMGSVLLAAGAPGKKRA